MKAKVGQYYYTPYGRGFRIYRYVHVTDMAAIASPVSEEPYFTDREAARRRVYELNGWNYERRRNNG